MTHGQKPHINKRRKDKLLRKLVDIAASVADNGMTDHAAGICAGNGVPFEVALRVITKPNQRRMYFYPDIDHHSHVDEEEIAMSILTAEKEKLIDESERITQAEKDRLKYLLRSVESSEKGIFIDPVTNVEIESITHKMGIVGISRTE